MKEKSVRCGAGVGRRKTSIARVILYPGSGKMTVNGREEKVFFKDISVYSMVARKPLKVSEKDGQFDVAVRVRGGGLSGAAGAISLGIARSLLEYDESLRSVLREHDCLTRDPRMKESKKYGRKKARRSFQFSKR